MTTLHARGGGGWSNAVSDLIAALRVEQPSRHVVEDLAYAVDRAEVDQ